MKLYEIKGNQFPTTEAEVIIQLKKYNIKNYVINSDLTVDVDGSVDVAWRDFTSFPLRFGHVAGYFNCGYCPSLTSFEGAPMKIDTNFNFSACPLIKSLEDFNQDMSVGGLFVCSWENIKTGGLGLVGSGVNKLHMPTGPFIIIQKYLGTDNIIECQSELIEAGFEEFAVL